MAQSGLRREREIISTPTSPQPPGPHPSRAVERGTRSWPEGDVQARDPARVPAACSGAAGGARRWRAEAPQGTQDFASDMSRQVRWWKVLGVAGFAGVAATGVLIARAERRHPAYTRQEIRERLHARVAGALETEAVGTEGFVVAAVVDPRCCGDLDAGPHGDRALVAAGSTIGTTLMGSASPSSSIGPNRGFSAPRVALSRLRRRQRAISGTSPAQPPYLDPEAAPITR